MLVIQNINLYWTKECRGAPYATIRNKMPCALTLPASYNAYSAFPHKEHYVYLRQNKAGFTTQVDKLVNLDEQINIRIAHIELVKASQGYELIFKYAYSIGQPTRTFADRQFKKSFNPAKDCIDNLLVEPIGILQEGDYARIIYNGRHSDVDTGNWYYTKNIVNLLLTKEDKVPEDLLLKEQPNILYEQLARLF